MRIVPDTAKYYARTDGQPFADDTHVIAKRNGHTFLVLKDGTAKRAHSSFDGPIHEGYWKLIPQPPGTLNRALLAAENSPRCI